MNKTNPPIKCNFDDILSMFDFSNQDISRTTKRLKLYSYAKDVHLPILYRHYKHYHDDEMSISGYKSKTQDYYTLFIFVDGKIGLFVSDNLYTSSFGKIITLKPEEDYTLFIYALENLEYFEFDFPKECFDLIPSGSPLRQIFTSNDLSCVELSENNREKLFHLLNKTDKTIESGNEFGDFVVYSILVQIAEIICRGKKHNIRINPILQTALHFISNNLTTLTNTNQIADYCNISVSYLCRLFKEYLDTTPLTYINNQKLMKSKFLLKNGYNVTESCYESGFETYNYFITKFKKTYGITPSEYQKSETKE